MTRQKPRGARKPAKTMADYAMSFEKLGHWLSKRKRCFVPTCFG
jgi:hypothetical protein